MIDLIVELESAGIVSAGNNKRFRSYISNTLEKYDQIKRLYLVDKQNNLEIYELDADRLVVTEYTQADAETIKNSYVNGRLLESRQIDSAEYNPINKNWYRLAMEKKELIWTNLYIPFKNKRPAITTAKKVGTKNILAIDIEVDKISKILLNQKVGQTGVAFIVNDNLSFIGYPDLSRILKKVNGNYIPISFNNMEPKFISAALNKYDQSKQNQFLIDVDGDKYFVSLTDFDSSFGGLWKTVLIVPRIEIIGSLLITNRNTLLIALLILLIAILLASRVAKSISRPIIELAEETEEIRKFNIILKKPKKLSYISEIRLMQLAIYAMKSGLNAFKLYVPAEVVKQLIVAGKEVKLGGERANISVMFSDIKGFTTLSEEENPEQLLHQLSEYFEEVTHYIKSNNGTIDKFIGDGIMSFWGAPVLNDRHVYDSCKAALLVHQSIMVLNQRWESEGKLLFPTRIGLDTGECIVGNVGSRTRLNYTAIGDLVNLTARLESANRFYDTSILVSENIYKIVKDEFVFRIVDYITVKGKKKPLKIYELIAEKESENEVLNEYLSKFEDAFNCYLKQEWDNAIALFKDLDGLTSSHRIYTGIYTSRCEMYKKNPPEKVWNGVYNLDEK